MILRFFVGMFLRLCQIEQLETERRKKLKDIEKISDDFYLCFQILPFPQKNQRWSAIVAKKVAGK